MASVTYWSQLQPSPRGQSIAEGLAARIRDPAWLLCRQWQVGEFQGVDGGSPAFARIGSHTAKVGTAKLGTAKVTLPEGEVPAILAATDSALDLAFLQLAQPPAKPLPFVDFAQATTPGVGEQVASVTRLGRGFDYAPCLQTARIGGALRKPREAWILDGTINAFGLPVFDLAGKPVGALTTIVTRGGEGEGSAGSPTIGQMLSGAAGMTDGPLGVFVLPGARVASLVKLARERAQELLKERAAAKP